MMYGLSTLQTTHTNGGACMPDHILPERRWGISALNLRGISVALMDPNA